MEAVLEDNGLKEFINSDFPKPTSMDVALLDAWQKKVAKTRRILLEGVKDHIVSSLHGKATPFAMWKALTDIFQSNNDHGKLALKDKLRKIKMEKGDSIPKYLTKFFQCRDELGSMGIAVADDDLVSLSLLELLKSWKLSRLCEWAGETSGLGATLVGSIAGGDKAEYHVWIFIKT